MSMTHNEVIERARAIWGDGEIVAERPPSYSNNYQVSHNGVWHSLDPNGHAVCHTKCEDLEADIEHRKTQDTLGELRQLVSEALAALDQEDVDHDSIDIREWCKSAKTALARTQRRT